MSNEEKALFRQAAGRLVNKFKDQLDARIVDGIIAESLHRFAEGDFITRMLQAESFASEHLRAIARLQGGPAPLKPGVLFLCVHNAGRSQMAAGFMRSLSGGQVDVFSGGSEPAERINPTAIEAMGEKGIDITGQIPQLWSEEIVQAVDVVISMGCGDSCPIYPATRYVDWEVDDPAGKPLNQIRAIRDDLEQRVSGLLVEMDIAPIR
jgi:protein-tyrosine-phosphatase